MRRGCHLDQSDGFERVKWWVENVGWGNLVFQGDSYSFQFVQDLVQDLKTVDEFIGQVKHIAGEGRVRSGDV